MPKAPRDANTTIVHQPRIYVAWSTVSLRTVVLWSALLVGLCSVGVYAYYQKYYGPNAPESRAQSAVSTAEDLLLRARDVGRGGFFEASIERASNALDESRAALAVASWPVAEARALDSQQASREVLDYIHETRKKGPTAKFVRVVGTVEVKKREESRWVPAVPQMALDPGDLIRSKAESSAQLIFFDGVSLVVSPQSLIEVELRGVTRDGLNRNPNVHLTVGTVDLSTPKFNVAGTHPSLSTDNVETTVRNDTDVRVARDEETHATDLVVSGSGGVEIQSSLGERADLLPNEGARVVGSGDEVRTVKRILPKTPLLVLPTDNKVFYDAPKEGIDLRWQNVSTAAAYHVQMSDSSLWARRILDKSDVSGEAVLVVKNLPFGDYYWRVATIDGSGNESAFSQYRKFSLPRPGERKEESGDATPPRLAVLKNMVFENIVIISGETEPGAILTVNDEKADVEENGRFTHFTVLYNDGPNKVAVVARDAAGNMTRRTIRVDVAIF